MPYIKMMNRKSLDDHSRKPSNAGELNYMVTRMLDQFLVDNGTNYARLNELVGMLECCKLELVRRILDPYEDTKISNPENGDVYTIVEKR